MTRLVTIREHGHLYRGTTHALAGDSLAPGDFDALKALVVEQADDEESGAPKLLRLCSHRGKESLQVRHYVGVIELPSGTQVEIMPKVSDDETEGRALLLRMLRATGGVPPVTGSQALLRPVRLPFLEHVIIDHTDAKQVAAIRYPVVERSLRSHCATLFESAFLKREQARLLVSETQQLYLRHFDLPSSHAELGKADRARQFSVTRSQLFDRIDAEPQAPAYKAYRDRIRSTGGRRLIELAEVHKPAGRYKTNYVTDAAHGIRMMNGRQIAQYSPIAMKLMSLRGFKDPEKFELQKGMTLLTSDGRAEENLADCVLVSDDRAGWAASGHVHRVVPREGVNAGLIYLACSSAPVQAQLKALATGSVVDALSEGDVGSVVIPYDDSDAALNLGETAEHCWNLFSQAAELERRATESLESAFGSQ